MQINCQALNSCIQTNYRDFKQDYCKITEFNGFDLYFSTKCTVFDGYSGLISFNNRSNTRTVMPMYLKQIQENHKVQIIATFENNITFYDNYYFPCGSVPKSGNFRVAKTK